MRGPAPCPDPGALLLDLRVDPGPRGTTVRVSGDVDMVSARPLAELLDRLCAQGCRAVDLDLSDVQFLAAAGLAVLVEQDRRYRAADARLRLVRPSRACRRLLTITGLDAVLTLV